jgi:flagellar basal body-associated protein FliL
MKGLSGYILALLITLILAAIGLVIFWIFLKNTTAGAKTFSEQVMQSLCNSLGILKNLIGC